MIRSLITAALVIAVAQLVLTAQETAFSTTSVVPAVKCGRLVDVRSGSVMTNVVVTLGPSTVNRGNRFREIIPNGTLPEGGIDLGTSTCLPGLIDMHSHLAHRYRTGLPAGVSPIVIETATVSPARRALIGVRMGIENLQAGITTVRDLGNSGFDIAVSLRDAIAAGEVPGPRMVAATRAISTVRGQFPVLQPAARQLIDQEYAVVNGVDEARRAVREAVYTGADVIKVIVGDNRGILSWKK